MLCCAYRSVVSDSATPRTVVRQDPLSMGILQARILEWVAMPSCRDLPNPGIKPRSPTLQVDFLPTEPAGKPKNTGVCSLSLLQGNFSTQESNPSLPHFRQILYPLSYEGSPLFCISTVYVQLLSHVRLCDPMDCSMPGFPVLHHLLEFAQLIPLIQ